MEVDEELAEGATECDQQRLLSLVEDGFASVDSGWLVAHRDDPSVRAVMYSMHSAAASGQLDGSLVAAARLTSCPAFLFITRLASLNVQQLQTELQELRGMFTKCKDTLRDVLFRPGPTRSAPNFERQAAEEKLKTVWTYIIALDVAVQMGQLTLDEDELQLDVFNDAHYAATVADCILFGLRRFKRMRLPVTQLIRLLQPFAMSDHIICQLVLNLPAQLPGAIERLIDDAPTFHTVVLNQGNKLSPFNRVQCHRARTLQRLLALRPAHTVAVVERLIDTAKQQTLCLQLLLEGLDDAQFCHCLAAWAIKPDSNLLALLQTLKASAGDEGLQEKLVDKLCAIASRLLVDEALTDGDGLCVLKDDGLLLAIDVLRLMALLKQRARLVIQGQQAEQLLRFICAKAPPSHSHSVHLLPVALATLVGCPQLCQMVDETFYTATVGRWLDWLLAVVQPDKSHASVLSVAAMECGLSELLLLLAFHFHANQHQLIAQLVGQTLRFKVTVKPTQLARLRHVFTEEVMPEQVIAGFASRMPVTKALTHDPTGFLPVHCVVQLLKTRSFGKHKINISSWIVQQVGECLAPVHPVMLQLLDCYIDTALQPQQPAQANQMLDQSTLMEFFADDNQVSTANLVPRLLVLYYLLAYDQKYEVEAKRFTQPGRLPKEYSQQLWSRVPVRFMMYAIARESRLYSTVYAPLVRLVSTQCPFMLTPPSALSVSTSIDLPAAAAATSVLVDAFSQAVESRDWQTLNNDVRSVLRQPLSQQQLYVPAFCAALPVLLEPDLPHTLLVAADALWRGLECVLARRLYTRTLAAFANASVAAVIQDHDRICEDPLLLFRCDPRLFSNVTVFSWYLSMLAFYLAASRRHIWHRLAVTPVVLPDAQLRSFSRHQPSDEAMAELERKDLASALIRAQESAVVQLLLELCLLDKQPAAVTQLICEHVHNMIIADTQLLRLVVYQGFAPELLPVLVRLVPSMYCCVDWLPEMLSQPNLRVKCFAINIMCALCTQFKLIRCLTLATLCVDTVNTVLRVLPASTCLAVMRCCVQPLSSMAQSCPPLAPQITALFAQVANMCESRLRGRGTRKRSHRQQSDANGPTDDLLLCEKLLAQIHSSFGDVVNGAD